MPGKVISTLDDFRKDTLNREKDSMLLMTRRWKGVEDALTPQIDALSLDIDALRAAGKDITPGKLYRMDRYKALLAQARNETAKYEGWAGRQIEQGQREYFELGNAAARTMLKDLLPPGVNIDFNRLPVDAVNNMIGLCKDGSPLFDVLKKRALFPEAVDGLTTQLINAMALGWNPRKTAEAMADGLAAGLNKALVIARTEQLRAYREATYQNYKANNDIVNGWVWHSALGTRTCAACWSMHGSVHSLDERLDDHCAGRCAMIPVTKSWSELGYTGIPDTNPVVPSGEDIFSKLSEEKQRGILGDTRFQMYKDGTLDFSKLSKFTDDPVWGRSLQITPLKELLEGGAKVQQEIIAERFKFVEATSIKEANEYATKVLGIPIADYSKLDIRIANEWNRGLTQAFNDFPELIPNFQMTGTTQARYRWEVEQYAKIILERRRSNYELFGYSEDRMLEEAKKSARKLAQRTPSNAYAYSVDYSKLPNNGVFVNGDYKYDLITQLLQNNVSAKFHPEGCDSIKAILDHEIAHQLDGLLKLMNNNDVNTLVKSSFREGNIKNILSKYAEKNSSEFIAEAWAEYNNNPNPRKTAQQIGDLIKKIYKARYKNVE